MDSYFFLKLIHILCAVVIGGTGSGIAFFLWMAYRANNIPALALTTRHVVLADWVFTTPAVIGQLITGILLMLRSGYSFTSPWFLTVMGLFIFIGICWLPVVWIQYRLKHLAQQAESVGQLDAIFHYWMRRWFLLGCLAFSALLVIFVLMVFKPLGVL